MQQNVYLETERLVISSTLVHECPELQLICDSWCDKMEIEGSVFEPDYIQKCFSHGDLPPVENASKSSYRLLSVKLKETQELIGFSDLYFGYPAAKTAWISIFVIHDRYRKNGYAQEVIKLISEECKKRGFSEMGIAVYLKNWRALRFWTKAGFNNVVGIKGDKNYSADAYARIELSMNLR
jgi:ribosomal protein S18 acetylase RimI-like enzyme